MFINAEFTFHQFVVQTRKDPDYVDTYCRIYELLRLKANTLWPAMHGYNGTHFHRDPRNARNTAAYGVTVGSSTFGRNAAQIPQVFIPYKEIQPIYEAGMDLPADVTVMWTDEDYGYFRQVPTVEEWNRPGGAGVYYHLSYHGSPNSCIWLCTTPLPLIREELGKAAACGAGHAGPLSPAHSERAGPPAVLRGARRDRGDGVRRNQRLLCKRLRWQRPLGKGAWRIMRP